ncbi:MAG: deoxyribodipyrimidine photo-lyase [Planctomycetota bacterium]
MRCLVWFRSDLRLIDNRALAHAVRQADDGVVGVFVVSPSQWAEHDWASIKVGFILRNLRRLSDSLAECRIPLRILTIDRFEDVPAALLNLARDVDAGAISFNREYEVNEHARDESVEALFRAHDLDVHRHHDRVILPPGSVMTQQGGWYSVFTPFRKAWTRTVIEQDGFTLHRAPKAQRAIDVERDDVPDAVDGFDAAMDQPERWPAGEDEAARRLKAFLSERVGDYDEHRDLPDVDGTSSLSPYLAQGVISPRVCLERARDANGGTYGTDGSLDTGPTVWISELIWRDFYSHLLVGFPRLSKHQPYKLPTQSITWEDDDDGFEAWCEGRTGFPIVDAAMRQLRETGWMHNRLRMITAMFLTKDLFIDWRRGERFFMQHLIDGDLAANNGGWQWSASTGTDAAPYFRIFNPTSQSKRYDPDGSFIRRFVPELRGLTSKAIHDPNTAQRMEAGYPEPVVDHRAARERVMIAFKSLK